MTNQLHFNISPVFNSLVFPLPEKNLNGQKVLGKEAAVVLPQQNMEEDTVCSTRILRLVLKKTGLYELFRQYVHDPRRGTCTYSVPSLLIMIVIMHILRFPSRNGFHEAGELSQKFDANIAKLGCAGALPCAKTFEDLFIQLDGQNLESVLPALFRWLLRSKFFKLHPEFMSTIGNKGAPFLLAIDGQVIHTYTDNSQHPSAHCPYCLKRSRGRAIWYLHYEVVLSVVGEHGFQMPLFIYRIKRQQDLERYSEDAFKQECELLALPHLLQQFRTEFPRLRANLLLDSLYANGPAMDVIKQYHLDFTIVRKEGSLQSLNSELQGLKTLISPVKKNKDEGCWEKKQEVYIYPALSHQGHNFTLIDASERCQKAASSRFAKVTEKHSHWQWMVSQNVNPHNVFKVVQQARLRWHQEDFFNTLQHRGFNLLHDFSRHPISQGIWHLLMLIAFAISMLMQLSRLGHLSRGSSAMINWIQHLLAILIATTLDLSQPLPKQLRFFFDTS